PPRQCPEVRHREEPVQDHVETVALLALDDGRLAAGDLLAPHAGRQVGELLAGKLREQTDARELGLGCGYVPRAHGTSMRSASGSTASSTGEESSAGSPSIAAPRTPACSSVNLSAGRSVHVCGNQSAAT